MGQSIEDDRRALEAEGAVKIRKIEVDYEQFEVSAGLEGGKIDDKKLRLQHQLLPYNGWAMIHYSDATVGVRVSTQGVLWHGRNMILPLLLLGALAALRRLIALDLSLLYRRYAIIKTPIR